MSLRTQAQITGGREPRRPVIPKVVLEYLEQVFIYRFPKPGDTEAAIFYMAGQQSVISLLKDAYKEQQSNVLGTEDAEDAPLGPPDS
jgi:hypothetical protein